MTEPVQQLASAVVAGSDAPEVENPETRDGKAVSEPIPDVAAEPRVREAQVKPDHTSTHSTNGARTGGETMAGDWVQIETDPGKLSHAQADEAESERSQDVPRRPKKNLPPPIGDEALIQIETRK